jgi:hypothetical protein
MIALLEMQIATANCSMTSLNIPSAVPDIRSAPPVSASWLSELSRIGWAWEFLRRNGDYRRQYLEQADPSVLEGWGLQYFEDPDLDSRHAQVFWRPDVCSAVLPVTAAPLTQTTKALDPSRLKCSTRIVSSPDGDSADVLFQQEGRFLQVAVTGARTIAGVQLLASVVPMPDYPAGRVLALRRFANLVTSSTLQPNLYPAERRAPRLTKVLQALDFWLAQRSYRDIGLRLFGETRVGLEWNDPRDHMRDQVRRAVYYGRSLMDGGYRQFLR